MVGQKREGREGEERRGEERRGEERRGEKRGKAAYRNTAYAGITTVRDHFTLIFAVEEIVVALHRDELGPTVSVGDVLQGLELPRCHLQLKAQVSICYKDLPSRL